MSSLFKVLVILCVMSLVAGCKVAVVVLEGGEVQSIGSGICAEGTICIVEVNDTNFSEAFTAVPNPGWQFVKWNTGEGFFCGDSTNPTCVLSTGGTPGYAGIEAVIASDQTFYIMPIFRPGPDTVNADGKEWLQPADFTGYTYAQVAAVCPGGACSGTLPGSSIDLAGYTWASIDEVSALFNSYGVDPPFTAPYQKRSNMSRSVNVPLANAFEVTAELCINDCPTEFYFIAGMLRDAAPVGEFLNIAWISYSGAGDPLLLDQLWVNNTNFESFGIQLGKERYGSWFWKISH